MPLLAHAKRVRPGNRALVVDDRAPSFAIHIDAVGRAQQLMTRVIHRAAASHVVLQILRGEGGQKLSLEVQVVHQLALKLGKLPMLHLRRGDQTVLRLAKMRLQRLMTRKHVGHELPRLRKQLQRHLRLAQVLGHMLIEAVQRVVREVAHLKRPESFVQVVQAQTPLSEPLVRALQIAFDLGRRKARLVEHLPALQHARKHHERTRFGRHRTRQRRLDARRFRRRRIRQRIVGAQGIFTAQQHPVLQMLGKRIRVVDVLGGRGVVPITVDELLQHHARVRGVGGRIVEAALEDQLIGCSVLEREERTAHAGKRRIGALHAKMLEQHPGSILGIGRRIGGACQVGRHEHLARAAPQRRRRALIGHQHIGRTKDGAIATARSHDA